jgi:uncharacterized protein (TIGR02145 family)
MKYFITLLIFSVFFIGSITAQVLTKAGWNLISIPVCLTDSCKSILFPDAVSPAYAYQGGYVTKDTLLNGIGYWLKFPEDKNIPLFGAERYTDTFTVKQGWNLIGSISFLVRVNQIISKPDGNINSKFFGYAPGVGYEEVDTLQPGKGYWVKVNQDGELFLGAVNLPCPGIPTVTYAGKTYNTVQIGNQCWLKENLDVGTMIQGIDTAKNNGTIEKYCYNNDTINCNTYGGLYQWYEAMQYSTAENKQDICPSGWHIPTTAEFQTLSDALGGDGNALKAIGQGMYGGEGTNISGFSALLAGMQYYYSDFYNLGYYALFWLSTHTSSDIAGLVLLDGYERLIFYYNDNKAYGFSIRCVKGPRITNNLPPENPSNPIPADNAIGQPLNLTLSWTCNDPDGDTLIYDVYFGTDNPPTTKVSSNQSNTSLDINGLSRSITYYWKVVAKDNHGGYTEGEVWRFANNLPPDMPSNPTPVDNAIGQLLNLTLSWTSNDPDNDTLTYDIYFGIDNPPATKVSSNQPTTDLARNGLSPTTMYYWKVVAKDNYDGITESPIWNFKTYYPCGKDSVDYEGKTYHTVLIGTQCWLKENLDVGTMILGTSRNNGIVEKRCYNNDSINCNTYGGLYTWVEAMQYQLPGGHDICPNGWHLPTNAQFGILNTTVGADGNALKAIGQGTGAGAGTNTSGFSALLSGYLEYNGDFINLGNYAVFWSSSGYGFNASYMYLIGNNSSIKYDASNQQNFFSVRCVKD